jgi:uncharacterized glyoxalase superfamily protein PhnB
LTGQTGRYGPDGKTVMHAELLIGDSRFFLGDEVPGMECRSEEVKRRGKEVFKKLEGEKT